MPRIGLIDLFVYVLYVINLILKTSSILYSSVLLIIKLGENIFIHKIIKGPRLHKIIMIMQNTQRSSFNNLGKYVYEPFALRMTLLTS